MPCLASCDAGSLGQCARLLPGFNGNRCWRVCTALGAKVFHPAVFGILIFYTLNPLVIWLHKLHLPRVIATTLVMAIMLGGLGWGANTLRVEFQSIME